MDISFPSHTPDPRTSSLFPRRLSAFLPTSCTAPSHSTLPPPPPQCNLLTLSLAILLFAYYILSLNNSINDQGFNYHVSRNGTYIYISLRPLWIPEPHRLQHICYFFDYFLYIFPLHTSSWPWTQKSYSHKLILFKTKLLIPSKSILPSMFYLSECTAIQIVAE